MYESLILLGCAAIFTLIYLVILMIKIDVSLFDIVLKDICVILAFIFIFFALSTNQVLIGQKSTALTYTMTNLTINTTTQINYTYAHDSTLDSLANGWGTALYAIGALFLMNMVYEVYDYITKSKKKR